MKAAGAQIADVAEDADLTRRPGLPLGDDPSLSISDSDGTRRRRQPARKNTGAQPRLTVISGKRTPTRSPDHRRTSPPESPRARPYCSGSRSRPCDNLVALCLRDRVGQRPTPPRPHELQGPSAMPMTRPRQPIRRAVTRVMFVKSFWARSGIRGNSKTIVAVTIAPTASSPLLVGSADAEFLGGHSCALDSIGDLLEGDVTGVVG